MPFEGERAQYKSIARVVENPRVKDMLAQSRVRLPDDDAELTLQPAAVVPSVFLPRLAIAIDGSKQELPAKNGFPGAEFAYVTVSSVILDVHRLSELDKNRPISPVEFRKLEKAESIDAALPGCNVIYKDEANARASFRRSLFDCFEAQQGWDSCENLLGTFEALLQHRQQMTPGCPWDECESPESQQYRGFGRYTCMCGKRALYSTDSLRIFEGINDVGSSGEAFGEVMQVLERLKLVHILRMIEQKNMLSVLPQIAFVVDGPLAVYGHPAWLSQSIYRELSRINGILRRRGMSDMLILGVEKTGLFANHLLMLDQHDNGTPNKLPVQSCYLLTDRYIKRNIVLQESQKIYGSQTYFGRKFFYKTRSGSLIVASVPFFDDGHRQLDTAILAQFPRLSDALTLLDQLETTRYPNALIPLTAAHAEASLPMNIGRKVLEQLARELMGPTEGKRN